MFHEIFNPKKRSVWSEERSQNCTFGEKAICEFGPFAKAYRSFTADRYSLKVPYVAYNGLWKSHWDLENWLIKKTICLSSSWFCEPVHIMRSKEWRMLESWNSGYKSYKPDSCFGEKLISLASCNLAEHFPRIWSIQQYDEFKMVGFGRIWVQ